LDLARRAVELDDHDHRAHCILGLTQLYARDYDGARRQLLRRSSSTRTTPMCSRMPPWPWR
jgi:hypothetical protein